MSVSRQFAARMLWATGIALSVTQSSAFAAGPEKIAGTRTIESPLSTANLVDTALGLLLVLGVMLAIAWLVKRFMQVPGVGKGQVQVLGGVSLGARERAVLITVDGRRLLVGVAPGRVQTLAELGEEPTPDTEFATRLADARASQAES